MQQVVISPENFSRYNDGLIQAAILRTAYPEELDYSSDNESSKDMLGILKDIFGAYSRPQGEASLEFASSLYSEQLKINADDYEELKQHVDKIHNTNKNNEITKTLRNLIFKDQSSFEEKTIPF